MRSFSSVHGVALLRLRRVRVRCTRLPFRQSLLRREVGKKETPELRRSKPRGRRRTRIMSRTLRTGTPGAEQYRQIAGIDVAVAVEISRVAGVRTPGAQKHRKVGGVNHTIPIDITHTIRSEG